MHRFYINKQLKDEILLEGSDVKHIRVVLRLKLGDKIYLTDCCQKTGLFIIKNIFFDGILVNLVNLIHEQREASICVTLAQGLTKNYKMDFIIQKAVELGVNKIIPLTVKNCVIKVSENKKQCRVFRWQKIANEAAKQCRRSFLPKVTKIQSLEDLLSSISNNTKIIMLYEGNNLNGIKTVLKKTKDFKNYLIIVGPEGGFCHPEIEICIENGAEIVSLGPRILRTETASIAAIAVVMYEYGFLGNH